MMQGLTRFVTHEMALAAPPPIPLSWFWAELAGRCSSD
jgi:hypothetical protein